MIKYFFTIYFMIITFIFSNCPLGFIENENQCYWSNDLIVLQKFIINSNLLMDPYNFGIQEWENGRLISLCYSTFSYDDCQQIDALSGEIPNEIILLDSLRDLRLLGNNLEGFIPSELGHLINLEYLDLSYNNLLGQIPQSFIYLNKLRIKLPSFSIKNNQNL